MIQLLAALVGVGALVTAISILTISSLSSLNTIVGEAFKEIEKEIVDPITGSKISSTIPKYDSDDAQKVRDLVKKFPGHISGFYFFSALGPAFLIGCFTTVDYSQPGSIIARAFNLEDTLFVDLLLREAFPYVIGVYLVYAVYLIYRVLRIKRIFVTLLPMGSQ